MSKVAVFTRALGINNVVESHAIQYREDDSATYFPACKNVIIDRSGKVRARHPKRLVFEGPVRNVWASGKYFFFVSDGKLYRYFKNGTVAVVSTSVGDDVLYYAVLNHNVFIAGSVFRGIVKDEFFFPWTRQLPHQDADDTRILDFPISFHRIFTHAGKMCLVDGNLVWISEPFFPSAFNMSVGPLSFASSVLDCVSISDGIYISDENGLYYYAGSSRSDMKRVVVSDRPAFSGSMIAIPLSSINPSLRVSSESGIVALWKDEKGYVIGGGDGSVFHVTEHSIALKRPKFSCTGYHEGYILSSMEV